MEVDYDIHGRANSRLAWLNTFVSLKSAAEPVDFNSVIAEILDGISQELLTGGHEIGHLKVYAVSGADYAKAGVTSSGEMVSFNKRMDVPAEKVNLILNARIEVDEKELAEITKSVSGKVFEKFGLEEI